jgi:molecular chaperone DnaJ
MPARKRDYYTELGVQPDASQDEIRTAYRSLAKKYHPDLHHGDPKAKERFQKIGEAYQTISDPKRRMEYHSAQGIKLRQKAAAQAAQPRDVESEGESFGVVLKRAFKSGFGILNREGSDKPRPQRGRNLHTKITLNPMQMAQGGKFLLTIRRQILCTSCMGAGVRPGGRGSECDRCLGLGEIPASKGGVTVFDTCPQCEGTGYSKFERCESCAGEGRLSKTISLRIGVPPNVAAGREIRIKGQGHEGAFGGDNGDLVVRIEESQDSGFSRNGDDLQITLTVDLLEAIGGKELRVPTPDGELTVRLNAGVLSGRPQRVTGKGLPKQGGGRGDLLIFAQTRIPPAFDSEAVELMEKLVSLPGWKVDRTK